MSRQKAKTAKKSPRPGLKTHSKKRKVSKRPTHKRFFLHPMTVMIMLLVGVIFAGYTFKAIADSYTVTAEVAAPPLTTGAYITNPTDNENFTNPNIEVDGTCPQSSYIKLNDNNSFIGVAWCQPDNTFQIAAQLYQGDNVLQVQDYNVTDEAGPSTPSVTAIYQVVNSSPGDGSTEGSSSGGSSTSSGSSTKTPSSVSSSSGSTPLLLTSDYQFQTSVIGNVFTWKLDLAGGTPPYYVDVNWGDDSSSNYVFKTDPIFTISHTYNSPGYYAIIVRTRDSKGNSRILQLVALIKANNGKDIFVPGGTQSNNCTTTSSTNCQPPNGSASSSSTPHSGSIFKIFSHIKAWVWLSWSTYIVIVLMMISFWLGEKEEDYRIFHKRFKYAHKHH